MGDDLLERDVQAAAAELEEAREALGDLHASEALLAVSGSSAKIASESERPEMYGNGCPGPTASGVSTGKISRSKRRSSCASSFAPRSSMPPTVIPSAASAGRSSRFQSRDWSAESSQNALADASERLLRGESVGGAHGDARLRLAEEAGDAHLEELVEVRGEDPAELHALEQRQRLVRRELENACVELEMRELAVEQGLDRFGADSRRHRCILYRQRAPWGEHPVKRVAEAPNGAGLGGPVRRALPTTLARVRSSAEAGEGD